MDNSIFVFTDKFNVTSPFDNWLGKNKTLRKVFINHAYLTKRLTLNFNSSVKKSDRQDDFALVLSVDGVPDRIEVTFEGKTKTAVRNKTSLYGSGNYILFLNKLVPPPYQSKSVVFKIIAYHLNDKSKVAHAKIFEANVSLDGSLKNGELGDVIKTLNNESKKEKLTEKQLKKISPYSKDLNIKKHLEGLNLGFEENDINNCKRIAHFLSQVLHESGGLRYTAELGVADTEYGGFKGRGLIQITHKSNYEKYEAHSGEDVTSSLENKKKLEKPPHAAQSAGWFWSTSNYNELADEDDFIMITRKINGGFNGYDDRIGYVKRAMKILCNKSVTDYKLSASSAYNDKRACFAWGLWHDPGIDDRYLNTCSNDKEKAIEGYQRFVSLVSEDYSKRNWYRIRNMNEFSKIKKTDSKNRSYVLVRKAAEIRLKALKNE